jgi:colanic acid/amylovoran biosynthesis glycosyltransferase
MRIAFFVSTFPKLSETFVVNQIAGLIDRGHEVVIYARALGSDDELHAAYRKYRLRERTRLRRSMQCDSWTATLGARLGLLACNGWRHPLVIAKSLNPFAFGKRALTMYVLDMATHFLDRPAYDVVHCHFGDNADDAAILMELGLLKGKLVATFHGYDIRNGIATSGKIYKRLVKRCDAVHSISNYNQKWLEAFGFDRQRIVFHPVGVDVGDFGRGTGKSDQIRGHIVNILTVARLVEEKGLMHALQALGEVRQRRPELRVRYRIIGSGPLEQTLQAQVADLGLGEIVEFMGPRDQEEVRNALSEADLFLLPSIAEALPVSIMEAMASSLPVLATDVGSVSELVKDGETGRLVQPANSRGLAKALLDLLDQRNRWSELGAAGRRLVEQRYDLEVLNCRLVEHYESLVAGSAGTTVDAQCSTR